MRAVASFVILGLLLTISANAQEPVLFSHLSEKDGLSNANVLCFTQDSLGFIWIGTRAGIQRFDGNAVHVFYNFAKNYHSQLCNYITTMAYHSGKIWVGTKVGIFCFDLQKEKYIPVKYSADSINNLIKNIRFEKNGRMWVSSSDGVFTGILNKENGLLLQKVTDVIEKKQYISRDKHIHSIMIDSFERVWLQSNSMLFEIKLNSAQHLVYYKQYPIDDARRASCIVNNKIYSISKNAIIETNLTDNSEKTKKVLLSVSQILKPLKLAEGAGTLRLKDFTIDSQFNFWIASTVGLIKISGIDKNQIVAQLFNKSDLIYNSISSNEINCFYIDTYENLWIGTRRGGVSYLNLKESASLNYVFNDKNEVYNPIRRFIHDNDKIWIASALAGIYVIKNNQVSKHIVSKSEQIDYSLESSISLVDVDKNSIWVSSANGIHVIDKKDYKIFPVKHFLEKGSKNIIKSSFLVKDGFNNIWAFSLNNDYYQFKKQSNNLYRVTNYKIVVKKNEGYPNIIINSVCSDTANRQLLLATSVGITRIKLTEKGDVDTMIEYRVIPKYLKSLTIDNIWQIEKGRNDTFYIATYNNGIYGFVIDDHNPKYGYKAFPVIESKTTEIKRFSNILYCNDYLWVTTNTLQVIDLKTKKIYNTIVNTGWQQDEFIGHAKALIHKFIYFGTSSGYVKINPANKSIIECPLKTFITELVVNHKIIKAGDSIDKRILLDKSILYTNQIELKHDENNLELMFNNQNYSIRKNNFYYYKLQGFDKEWHTSTRNYIMYTNLDPGSYIFYVSSAEPIANSKYTTKLLINIRLPLWKTPWFIAICVLAVLTVSLFVYLLIRKWMGVKKQLVMVKESNQVKLNGLLQYVEKLKTKLIGSDSKTDFNIQTKEPDKEFIETVKQFIVKNITESNYSTEMLSADLGMSIRNLQLKLKSITGSTPSEYIRNVRLEKAVALLTQQPDLRIAEVAYQCGFVSAAHFSKCFRERYQVNPKQFSEHIAKPS